MIRHAALLFAVCLALPAAAQVPQDFSFSGRLVDGGGTPVVGPVTLELWIYDAALGGTAVYAEEHASIPLDGDGGFAVLLGSGADAGGPFPAFDPALFSDSERYVEVRVGAETLSPRVPLAAVPWSFIARQANEVVPDPNAPFEDCGDGTVADPQNGLLWEKKTGVQGDPVDCETAPCPDLHDVNNRYEWSNILSGPNGNAFTDFLVKLNDPVLGSAPLVTDPTGCLAGHCDWRLPTITELQTIVDCSFGSPCIDPVFGPTSTFTVYWSASTGSPASQAWVITFENGDLLQGNKESDFYVRAVRVGTCH
jgi:hypothetical protein